jgi:hypothetical protein
VRVGRGRGGAALTCLWIALRRVGAGGSCDRFSCLESFNKLSFRSPLSLHFYTSVLRANFGKKLSLSLLWLHYTIAPQPIAGLFVCHLSLYLSIYLSIYMSMQLSIECFNSIDLVAVCKYYIYISLFLSFFLSFVRFFFSFLFVFGLWVRALKISGNKKKEKLELGVGQKTLLEFLLQSRRQVWWRSGSPRQGFRERKKQGNMHYVLLIKSLVVFEGMCSFNGFYFRLVLKEVLP